MQPNQDPQQWQQPSEQPSQAPYEAPPQERPAPVVTITPDNQTAMPAPAPVPQQAPAVAPQSVVTPSDQLDQELDKEINSIYNLNQEHPIRVCLYELMQTNSLENVMEHYLSIVIHHIAFDGWSMDILLKELKVY